LTADHGQGIVCSEGRPDRGHRLESRLVSTPPGGGAELPGQVFVEQNRM